MTGKRGSGRKISASTIARRARLRRLLEQRTQADPILRNKQLAALCGVDKSTIDRDLKSIRGNGRLEAALAWDYRCNPQGLG